MKKWSRWASVGICVSATALLLFQNCGQMGSVGDVTESSLSSLSVNTAATRQQLNSTAPAELVQAMKFQACMFNSLVYPNVPDFNDFLSVLKRSPCLALPRVIETWNNPPDFAQAQANIQAIENFTDRSYIYGMFLAESILTTFVYPDDRGGTFNFAAMCRAGTMGTWGADTCVPDLSNAEYRRYVLFIASRAMDIGIQDFLFGQSGHTDPSNAFLPSLVQEIRQMANSKGISVIVGQQPNGIQSAAYLRSVDYVVTPAYVDANVSQKCLPGTNCQAVYFHPDLASLPNNVIAEIDWSSTDDDIHRLARKSASERHVYLEKRYKELKARNIGFVLPYRIFLNGGSDTNCKGVNQYVYSASNSYECKDEKAWGQILKGLPVGASGDSTTVQGPLSGMLEVTARAMVTQAYLTILKRQPDTAGLNFYVSELVTGRKTVAQMEADLKDICARHVNNECPVASTNGGSSSGGSTTSSGPLGGLTASLAQFIVENAYKTVLGRTPAEINADPSGVQHWVRKLQSGMTEAQLKAELMASDEYFVRQQYLTIFKRPADASGLAFYLNQLKTKQKTRAQITADFRAVCAQRTTECR